MIQSDGSVIASGRVVLKHHNRDVFIIERAKLSRVFIEGPKLCWINQDDSEGRSTDVGSDYVCEIFDAIMFQISDVVFVEHRDSDELPAGWTRLGREWKTGGSHPGNAKP